jgi:hypothetical protein
MLLAARYLASQGWGFPLIHDITDCLRIGDLTFVRLLENSELSHVTAEVKTRAEFKRHLESGRGSEYEYQITAFAASAPHGFQADPDAPGLAEFKSVISHPAGALGSRTGRQARRMSTALLHQAAEPNTLVTEDGSTPGVWATITAPTGAHWKSLQRVVRKARRTGYGSECADGAFLYAAFYSRDGISLESLERVSRLPEDLSNSALPITDGSRPNLLQIASVPTSQRESADLFLPFYLYPIPHSSICDLIYRRMVIIICYNYSRLIESLEGAGFDVTENQKTGEFSVRRSITTADGSEYTIQSPDLRYFLNQIIYEFKHLDSLVEVAKALLDAAENITPNLVREAQHEGKRSTSATN